MRSKASTTKKTTTAKAASHKAKGAKSAKGAKAKASWAETMKNALEKRQPSAGIPKQPKPRDSGVQPVRKNAF